MYQYFLLVVFMWASVASAQEQAAVPKKKGSNFFLVSYSGQYYFDKNSVRYHDQNPEKIIFPKNTFGSSWQLCYERITRYGLVVDAGLAYGVRKYDITISQDMSNFDPSSLNDLKGFYYFDTTLVKVKYWGYHLLVGYRKQLERNLAIVGKGGVALKLFYDGIHETKEDFIFYHDDNGYATHAVEVANLDKRIGRDPAITPNGFLGRNRFPEGVYTFEFYIGLERQIRYGSLRYISMGIECSRNWTQWTDSGVMSILTSSKIGQVGFNRANFYDRNLSLGLRIAVGLWK